MHDFLNITVAFSIFVNKVNSFTPIVRISSSSILVGKKFYFFGGYTSKFSNEVFYLDVSQSFNSENQQWIDLTPSSPIPFGSAFATVSLIDDINPTIYLFGGFMVDSVSSKDIFESFVHKFNPQTLKWDIPKTNGQIPKRRRNVEAVKDNFGKFYIFGVAKNINMLSLMQIFLLQAQNDQIIICGGAVGDTFQVLNTQTTPFEWIIPQVSSNIGEIPSLVNHKATLVENYIIVAFGNITQQNALPLGESSKIYLLDIRNYTWVNTFEPLETNSKIVVPNSQTPSNTPDSPYNTLAKELSTMKIVISVISSLL
ncbi:15764_t:CDS:2, partial [Funneliformis geosporum]